jgi:hypothetical protein
MKIIKNILLGLLGIIVLIVVISFFLSSDYKVVRSANIHAPLQEVFAELNDLQRWKDWNPWQKMDTNMIMTYSGPQSGVGATQEWKSEDMGNGKLWLTEIDSNHFVKYEMQFEDFPPMKGRFELSHAGDSTKVEWIAEGNAGKNPLSKYFALMMDNMMGKDFEEGLANMKKVCE